MQSSVEDVTSSFENMQSSVEDVTSSFENMQSSRGRTNSF
jgi:phage-related protein